MEKGKVYIMKTTGEQVIALADKGDGVWQCRRPVMTVDNGITHDTLDLYEFEVAPLKEHLQSEIDNMKMKQLLQKQLEPEVAAPANEPNLSVN